MRRRRSREAVTFCNLRDAQTGREQLAAARFPLKEAVAWTLEEKKKNQRSEVLLRVSTGFY